MESKTPNSGDLTDLLSGTKKAVDMGHLTVRIKKAAFESGTMKLKVVNERSEVHETEDNAGSVSTPTNTRDSILPPTALSRAISGGRYLNGVGSSEMGAGRT